MKRVLRYLEGSKHICMQLGIGDLGQLNVYVDSSWCIELRSKRRSRTGILMQYGSTPIYVCSVLQRSIVMSSTEAECLAPSAASKVIASLRQVLTKLNILQALTTIFQKILGAIEWAQVGPAKHHGRRKHIYIRYSYVMYKVESKEIELKKFPTVSMPADSSTKPLGPSRFVEEINKTAICN